MLDINHKIKQVIRLEPLTRRKFLRRITVFSLFFLLKPYSYSCASGKERRKILPASQNLIEGKFDFFTQYQATVIDEVTSLLIPTDELPGAREAGVVFELDRKAVNSDKLKKLYTDGIEWLTYMAEKYYDKENFLGLSYDEKLIVLKMSDSGRFSYVYKIYLFIRYRVNRTVRRFFSTIKKQTFEVFYTGKTGWKVVGYPGPPQWSGHLDYHECT